MSGVRHSGEPPPERRPRGGTSGLVELALGERADVGAGGEGLVGAGDHDAADLGVGVEALEPRRPSSSISAGERALRASGRFSRQSATCPSTDVSTSAAQRVGRGGTIALIPVASRPMISFWICEVPS